MKDKGKQYCHDSECDSRWGLGLNIGFIDHSTKKLVTTPNHRVFADFHTFTNH
jgi:hypothetical protein